MTAKSDLTSGTITLTNGSVDFVGVGTSFAIDAVQEGDEFLQIAGQTQWQAMVATVADNTHGTLVRPWGGATGTYAYRLRYQNDGTRMGAQARNLIELIGDGTLLSVAGLVGPGVIELLPGGGAQVVPKSDLISGAAYDVQVANLAARAAYDGQAAGYAVLVADTGAGRAAIYSKNSSTSADWSAPAFVTGPVGAASTVPGITWRGTYSGATAYVVNDGVKFNGSSFRNIVAGTGNAPSSAAPPVDNTWWVVVAAKGTDGTGTGDMVGPAGAIDLRIAVFDGPTGKLLKDGGKTIAELVPAGYDDLITTVSMLALQVADNSNVALFLGPSGNRVADSFEALTYVDVAGATNLDSATAGVLKPTITAAVMIPAATGTVIGNFDTRQSAAFDGTTSQAVAASALKSASLSGYVGKDFTSAPKTISAARTFGSSDSGYASAVATTINLRGKNGSAPASASDGTLLGTSGSFADVDNANQKDIVSSNFGPWDYVWLEFVMAGSSAIVLAEAQFFAAPVANNVTVRSASFAAASAPTKMKALIRVKEADAATAGTDYTLECSRDGGTTWSTMTLTELFTSPSPTAGIRVVEAAETSVAGQPSGTAPRWRFKTLNTKNVELHDVYIYWS